ncbi:ferric reductase NAD binding domain-domain-containing protein [Coniella lustricola]|uniref:Ferric reductase NAD binding domain-domain-containing protein n=1 Tax=Coniella lustricola TaxID=2025994 RepID=A0A2T3AHW6_9PEZI|nr:ferric reductase NAD binding domain-domain-containing protein [Coniella lustricola]
MPSAQLVSASNTITESVPMDGISKRGWNSAAAIIRTQQNQQQLRYFAAAICGLIAVFILSHWLHLLLNHRSPQSNNPVRAITRKVRKILIRKVTGLTSSGHALVVASYVAINLSLTFTNVTISISGVANRCGWMLVANFCLVVFLALKNTPLAILSAYSYERLNGLHQIAGYTTFAYLVLHASMYTDAFFDMGSIAIFKTASVKAGIVAGFGFLGVVFSAAIVRHIWYEAFFVMHVVCFMVTIIAASFHQSDLSSGLLVIFSIIAGMWGADRLVRGSRVLVRSINNHATIEPLPHGGTKIVLAKRPKGAIPGKHCFVWIPAIRKFESHPFTIAATEPMEFVVNACDGFTRDLHKHATLHPGAKLMASVDGPYGTFPDPLSFDKVVLIAGGSGATFTFGLAINMLERMTLESTNHIAFIWAVKKHDNLSWFTNHLQTLKNHPNASKVNVALYVTSVSSNPPTAENSDVDEERMIPSAIASLDGDDEKKVIATLTRGTSADSGADNNVDPEKGITISQHVPANRMPSNESLNSFYGHNLRPGRPDTATLIRGAVSSAQRTEKILVAACGPSGLMKTVRNTTASLISVDGPGIELHCEQFGW